MERPVRVAELLAALRTQAPAGYAIALHVKFSTPTFLFQTYPEDWAAYYSENGLVMQDPTVLWGFYNEGHAIWADLAAEDEKGILTKAAEHGLVHGFTTALVRGDSRSLAGFARADRAFTQDEIAEISQTVAILHDLTANSQAMPKPVADALRALSVNQSHSI